MVYQEITCCETILFSRETVLKKVYFEDYRFSEDMDFTLLNDDLGDEKMEASFEEVFDFVTEETAMEFRLERPKHNFFDTYTFYIEYVASLGGNFHAARRIKVDITRHEQMEHEVEERAVYRDYSDIKHTEFTVKCYPLVEVLIEKMAAVMGRSQPRDLYDLWLLLEEKSFDILDHWFAFESKARNKKVQAENFTEVVLGKEQTFKKRWETSLQHQVKDLPGYNDVFRELSRHLRKVDKFLKK